MNADDQAAKALGISADEAALRQGHSLDAGDGGHGE
jgi:hypothetical protein